MKERIAVYAASLDPITYGHINIIERMAPLYDKLIVIVGVSGSKGYLFSMSERIEIVKEVLKNFENVEVVKGNNCYLVKQAKELGAQVLIRGLRDIEDFRQEKTLFIANKGIEKSIETITVFCESHLEHVSSSLIKGHMGIDPEWVEQVEKCTPTFVLKKVKEKYAYRKAQVHWYELMKDLGNPENSREIFERIIKRYSEPHRAYHTLEHIVSMLDELGDVFDNIKSKNEMRMAIWYHDYSYDVYKPNPHIASNEERSVYNGGLNMEVLGISKEFWSRVSELIMATEHKHEISDSDSQYLVDLDLAILGKSQKVFDEYEDGIRKEYNEVPEDIFRSARAQILQTFLDRPSIYLTEYFKNKYEKIARENLESSIVQLKLM